MAHVTSQQEFLTDAGPDQCLEAANSALAGIHSHPSEPAGGRITGQVGSYGMYDYHARKHPEELPVALAVAVEDLGAQRKVTVMAESAWPFEAVDEWVEKDYQARCQQVVAMLQASIAQSVKP